jgi:hypothetical protein
MSVYTRLEEALREVLESPIGASGLTNKLWDATYDVAVVMAWKDTPRHLLKDVVQEALLAVFAKDSNFARLMNAYEQGRHVAYLCVVLRSKLNQVLKPISKEQKRHVSISEAAHPDSARTREETLVVDVDTPDTSRVAGLKALWRLMVARHRAGGTDPTELEELRIALFAAFFLLRMHYSLKAFCCTSRHDPKLRDPGVEAFRVRRVKTYALSSDDKVRKILLKYQDVLMQYTEVLQLATPPRAAAPSSDHAR